MSDSELDISPSGDTSAIGAATNPTSWIGTVLDAFNDSMKETSMIGGDFADSLHSALQPTLRTIGELGRSIETFGYLGHLFGKGETLGRVVETGRSLQTRADEADKIGAGIGAIIRSVPANRELLIGRGREEYEFEKQAREEAELYRKMMERKRASEKAKDQPRRNTGFRRRY
jgi:hypothetical protein